jgi:hypothetical protein
MAIDPNNALIGPVRVEFGGFDLGITTDDGASFQSEQTVVDLTAPQSVGMLDSFRSTVSADVTVSLRELHQSNLALLFDLADAPASNILQFKPQHRVTKRPLVITGAGPNGGVRILSGTAGVVATGEVVMNTSEYASCEVTFRFYINPVTGSYFSIQDSVITAIAPVVSAWEYFTANIGSPTALTDGLTTVPRNAKFLLTFAAPVRPDQVTPRNFILKSAEGNTDVPATFAFDGTDFTRLVITPNSNLAATTDYDLIVPAGLVAMDGTMTNALVARQFRTVA